MKFRAAIATAAAVPLTLGLAACGNNEPAATGYKPSTPASTTATPKPAATTAKPATVARLNRVTFVPAMTTAIAKQKSWHTTGTMTVNGTPAMKMDGYQTTDPVAMSMEMSGAALQGKTGQVIVVKGTAYVSMPGLTPAGKFVKVKSGLDSQLSELVEGGDPTKIYKSFGSSMVNGLRAGRLAGVRDAVQPGRDRRLEVRLELRPRDADLRPAEPEPDQTLGPDLGRDPQRLVGARHAVLTGDVEDPPQHQAEVFLGRDPGVLDRLAERLGGDPADHRRVRRDGQLGVPQVLLAGHLAGDLVGEQPHVLGRLDQLDDGQVDVDEVGEVAELEVLGEQRRVGRHRRPGVPRGQLGHDPRRRGPDVVDMQLGLRQPGEELVRHSHAGDPKESPGFPARKLTIECKEEPGWSPGPREWHDSLRE